MGLTLDSLEKYIDYDKLWLDIKDFSLLIKVIEHLENVISTTMQITMFHLCTIVYTKEDLEKIIGGGK